MTALAGCRDPYLIGVRHHSPALAAAVPALLAAADPEVVLIELPEEFAPWLDHLGDPATVPPVALAGSGGGLVFLPFADFSPELAAIRWARQAGVEVVPFDLPLGARTERGQERQPDGSGAPSGALTAALHARAHGRAGDDLWDRLVEASAPGCEPEALRRAALLVGWALRADSGAVSEYDLRREAHMRRRLASYRGRRTAAVIGSFHAPALRGWDELAPSDEAPAEVTGDIITSLVPYSYPLLDERSGYPAGIRDPEWQHGVFTAAGDPRLLDDLLTATAVRICAAVRDAGHPSGPADAREVVRMARDLAALRGLPAPGRGELAEAAQTVLTQGRLLGRGRVVAAAMERVLVGARRGRLAPTTPRSGLGPAVEALLTELKLPRPEEADRRELRLDMLRTDLDRRREITLRRLAVCRIPYGEESSVAGVGDAAALTTRWVVGWSPSTAAMLDVAGLHGVTLEQATEGFLRQRRTEERRRGGPSAQEALAGLAEATRCVLPALAVERLVEAAELLPATGTLPELLSGMALLDRIRSGHVPGLDAGWERAAVTAAEEELAAAGVRALDGLAGSTEPADAHALVSLAEQAAQAGGGLRLADALGRLEAQATPLMRGAAGAARVLLGQRDPAAFGTGLASRADGAATPELRVQLAEFLRGALLAAGPLLETGRALDPLVDRVESLADRAFLARLPALRAGFDVLSPAARARLLTVVEDRTGTAAGTLSGGITDPTMSARLAMADLAGGEALASRGLQVDPVRWASLGTGSARGMGGQGPAPSSRPGAAEADRRRRAVSEATGRDDAVAVGAAPEGSSATSGAAHALSAGERWRLLLGRGKALSGTALRYATALDELYGSGRGEGSRGADGYGQGGGTDASYPDVRAWSDELAALFGPGVREEVLAAAADSGRLDAALALDPAAARPSVELLRTVLSFAGGLPEQQLARLRPLVARLVKELTDALANRLRPALTGLAHPRPTRRPGGPLDLPRTLRANLTTARRDPDTGVVTVLPERPVFRTRARRSTDWRLVLVVDVSGSMEASTIWSALTASVLAGVPALSTHFVAFSTEVLDLTDHVDDPLALLLEVRVGGGTNIARGLRHARELVTVPSRTLVVLVSDFEEGGPIGPLLSEVRTLVDAGCHVLGCASLDDEGRPRYSTGVAGQLVAAGMPVAALSPLELARWVGERVGGTHR
ncbi:DUF5682 family protein [Streptomyces sp. CWNU-1]|uniref:DUF5682 family protein n=2 Tax=Streptomyces albipurpureus TaxID=2897419 RepID=A0ABT0UIS8_9ACTN|nr:DUF5682 family protein [Streptomyces sp. CWNU-1]MCM2388543.1 DUF5682 family protein [Streptomyces sp. CWNU-1]